MRILIAGASGAIGRSLVPRFIAQGHEVSGLVRDEAGAALLRDLGCEPCTADALDAEAVDVAVAASRPDVVVDQLTALPSRYTPEAMRNALEVTARLRTVGGANLQRSAEQHGAKKYVVQSGCYYYEPGDGLADETCPFTTDAAPLVAGGVAAFEAVERRVLGSDSLDGVVLRYGFFYGPGTWYWPDGDVAASVRDRQLPILGDGSGVYPFVHIDDAADATVTASVGKSTGVFNVTDDEPKPVNVWLPRFADWVEAPPPRRTSVEGADADSLFYATKLRGASNAKSRDALNFRPRKAPWL